MNVLVIPPDACSPPQTLQSKARHLALPSIGIIDSAVQEIVTVNFFFFCSLVWLSHISMYISIQILFSQLREIVKIRCPDSSMMKLYKY